LTIPGKPPPEKSARSKKSVAGPADQASLGQALLQSTGAGIYIIKDGKFVYLSPFFESLSGYAAKELLGQDSFKLVHPDDREMVRKVAIGNLKRRRVASPYEYRFLKKNGDFMWVMERVSPIEYKGQRATLGSFMDIQQRKELEEAVAASEQMHSTILSQMHDACFETDLSGNFSFTNNSLCRGLMYKVNELNGKNFSVIIPEEDQEAACQALNQVFKSGKTISGFAHRVRRKDGIILQVESTISVVREKGGEVTGSICVSRDVTKAKLLEAALHRSEEMYRRALEQMHDSYYELDLAGNFTFVNDSVCSNLLYTREELLGKNFNFVVPPDEVKKMFLAFNEVFKTGQPDKAFSHRILRKDGETLYAETTIELRRDEAGRPIGFRSISRDVTERKQLEEALQGEKNFTDSVLDSMPGIFYTLDEKGDFTRWNKNEETVTGYTGAELRSFPALSTIAEEDRELVAGKIRDAFTLGNAEVEASVLAKDGSKTRYLLTGARVGIGNRTYLVGMGIDISERKKAEMSLKQSEERYRALFDSSLELVYLHDFEGRFLDANRATLELFGYSKEEISTLNFASLLDPEDIPRAIDALKGVNRPGAHREMHEFRLRRKDGSYVYIETQASLIRRDGKPYAIQGIARNIDERKMFEQLLSEMATHDFLTGLPNRVLLNDRFNMALSQAHRNKNRLAIIAVDLDRFKSVNDTLGHQAGDELLKAIAQRLKNLVRSSDTVARMGGDEFLLLMPELHVAGDATRLIEKIAHAFKEPFIIGGGRLNMSASMGLAIYPDDGEDMDALMRKSDAAMYNIKRHGPSEGWYRYAQEET
jgi:diguanylate cyclase (GGDEF)-like protein/PAS domain S-box-containing protein